MERRSIKQSGGPMLGTHKQHQPHQPFPTCAIEVLEQVNKFCSQQGQKWRGPGALRNNELQYYLDRDLFCVSPDRRILQLNHIKQLRLLQILCEYFNEREHEGRSNQYLYFEAIFCGREGEAFLHEIRVGILINLCSLSVQYPSLSVLGHVAQWLNKIGSGKYYAQQFVSNLVDHYILSPGEDKMFHYLLPLSDRVPNFASYFVVYSVTDGSSRDSLITVLNQWLTGSNGQRIMNFIKENQSLAQEFATVTFPNLVVYDCMVGGEYINVLHGVMIAWYVEWDCTSRLNVLPAFEALANDEEFASANEKAISYHVRLALLAKLIIIDDLNAIMMKARNSVLKTALSSVLVDHVEM